MATKNISITEDAYKRLANLKRERESFSEVIVRVTGKSPLRNIYGILSGKRGEEFEKTIIEGRKKHADLHKERMKGLVWGSN